VSLPQPSPSSYPCAYYQENMSCCALPFFVHLLCISDGSSRMPAKFSSFTSPPNGSSRPYSSTSTFRSPPLPRCDLDEPNFATALILAARAHRQGMSSISCLLPNPPARCLFNLTMMDELSSKNKTQFRWASYICGIVFLRPILV
jgi:hypothetical protein